LNYSEPVASHPKQKALLTFGSYIDSGVEECSQQPAVTEKDSQKFVVINIDVVESRCVKKIIAIYENCDSPAMSQLP
jgi:hypothetical protein